MDVREGRNILPRSRKALFINRLQMVVLAEELHCIVWLVVQLATKVYLALKRVRRGREIDGHSPASYVSITDWVRRNRNCLVVTCPAEITGIKKIPRRIELTDKTVSVSVVRYVASLELRLISIGRN